MSEEYKVGGSFANNSIVAFKRYVKDGVLDVEAVTKDYALNEGQIPHLEAELKAAGYLEQPEDFGAVSDSRVDTAPLPAIEETEEEE
jgi:hypothetical protein